MAHPHHRVPGDVRVAGARLPGDLGRSFANHLDQADERQFEAAARQLRNYREPAEDLSARRFLTSLLGHLAPPVT